MGIYDRDYYQDDAPQGFTILGGPRLIVTNLVIITAAISLIDIFTPAVRIGDFFETHWLSHFLGLKADLFRRPWEIWNLLSYGFAHTPLDQGGFWHVGMNMLMLWMFGRVIELRLGRLEFLWFYLVSIVAAGLVWLAAVNLWQPGTKVFAVGASGGVTATFILFVLYYPRQTVYFWGIFAMPAWVIGVIVVGLDLLNALTGQAGNVAWQAHFGGAAFAFVYARFGWRLSSLLSPRIAWPRFGSRARLRLHAPDADDDALDSEADRILDKVHRQGEQSLTGRERRILERYSRRMRDKRRQ
jgi:membrane associated rhomboid family serine protease